MKYVYYVVDDNAMFIKSNWADFQYFVSEFGRTFFDKEGREKKRREINPVHVHDVFNPEGALIAYKRIKALENIPF